jgi:GTP-binding protein YchF
MKIAIIGLSNSGKTTVYNALTGYNLETTVYPTSSGDPHLGVIKVPDSRLDKLSQIFKPKKTSHATTEYIDYIGLTKGNFDQNRNVFDLIKNVDAILHVVRAFKDDTVMHPLGNLDPLRDVATIEMELMFGDLELIEKRLDKIELESKRGKKPDESEKKLLLRCKDSLAQEVPLRDIDFDKEEENAMRHLQFLSIKPELVVLNIGEEDLKTEYGLKMQPSIAQHYASLPVLTLCGKIEMEIAQLSHNDALLFLEDLGIPEAVSTRLIRKCYEILGLITFYSYVGDEVRAWTIQKGTPALKAAGKIHSDIERGFIRAEVISFDDFIASGDMHTAREKGILRLEGKNYEVKDGDIIHFRFNV